LGALTILGFLDRLTPYLEVATVFRLHYAVVLGLATLAAVFLRLHRVALIALILVGLNIAVIAPAGTALESPSVNSPRLRLLLVNVEFKNDEYTKVSRLIAETDPDVVGITELTPAWKSGLRTTFEHFPNRTLESQEGAYGIGLYSKLPFEAASVGRFPAEGPPAVVATIVLGGRRVGLVLTHVHPPFAGGIHSRQLEALGDARGTWEDLLAVCGDFNAVPWSHSFRRLESSAGLESIHERFGLGGTWPAWMPVLRLPLDNCLVSRELVVVARRVGPDVGSDHLPLIVELGMS
jgi:endonuclease/exonuclease/phosphatase (EEP) superfamily protein YafD